LVALASGLAVLALGVASATIWRPPDRVTARHEVADGIQVLVTEPGVLEAQATSVEITVAAQRPVVLAVGRDTDVAAWIGDSPAEHLTGFLSRESFTVAESGSDVPIDDPADCDLWVLSRQFETGGTLRWDKREGRWSLALAAKQVGGGQSAADPDSDPAVSDPNFADSDAAPATLDGATISMTWSLNVSTPWFWPAIAVGSVLMTVGGMALGLSVYQSRGGRKLALATADLADGSVVDQAAAVRPSQTSPKRQEVVVAAQAESEAVPEEPQTASLAGGSREAKKGRWFRRRRNAPVSADSAPEAPDLPPEPKLDLGLATPNRNWEKLASSQFHYPDDGQDQDGQDHSDAFGDQVDDLWPVPLPPSTAGPTFVSDSDRAQTRWSAGAFDSMLDDTHPGGHRSPSARSITAAEKIAALREARSEVADEAAAIIAAAQAAAAGVGSAAGLTRRQIRDAERAAAEALHVKARRTGEVPPWHQYGDSATAGVEMQADEGSDS
jgi:hypothetical protein